MITKGMTIRSIATAGFIVLGFNHRVAQSADLISDIKVLYGDQLEIVGPVESINVEKRILTVAGQVVIVSSDTRFDSVRRGTSESWAGLANLHTGDQIAVSGRSNEAATSVLLAGDDYVPGSSKIFVKGEVTAVHPDEGVVYLNGLRIDITPAMSRADFSPLSVGDSVEIAGIQPSLHGDVLAEEVARSADIHPEYVDGTGASARPDHVVVTGASARPNYVVGTGSSVHPEYVVGTGASARPSYVVGTGASVHPEYVVGTGASVRPDHVVGTGASARPSYVVGTGASVRPDHVVGTGTSVRPDHVVGTGASVRPGYVVGTGNAVRAEYVVGTGGSH
ncbi:MAG TPA: DUF5666 domain-containing protein [Steroidobacteraceae bacterium]|nr:DUF5666 domain-containing protein [Steroidobacteraceae bacterium]